MKLPVKIFLIISLLYVNSFAQDSKSNLHSQMNIDCKQCHVCDTPTKSDPCLVLCPRYKIEVVRRSPEEGPEEIILDNLKEQSNLYGLANFTHKLHSEMSLMSGGCSVCHHFNPPGNIVKCSSCHEINRKRTDISRPDLKAAYHRMCITCHSSWEENVECFECHELNSAKRMIATTKPIITEGHPQLAIPAKLVYKTDAEAGQLVTFYHNEHTGLFNRECTDCHSSESCAKCHNKKVSDGALNLKKNHERCSSCHDTENKCSKCHNENELKPFNHFTSARFNLNKYHVKLSCISCHSSDDKFAGLNPNCTSCHKWASDNFDHKVTRVILDETHSDFECEDCHEDIKYNIRPTCINCHEEEISFPNNLPGERIQ